jgi:hypothetical protein
VVEADGVGSAAVDGAAAVDGSGLGCAEGVGSVAVDGAVLGCAAWSAAVPAGGAVEVEGVVWLIELVLLDVEPAPVWADEDAVDGAADWSPVAGVLVLGAAAVLGAAEEAALDSPVAAPVLEEVLAHLSETIFALSTLKVLLLVSAVPLN